MDDLIDLIGRNVGLVTKSASFPAAQLVASRCDVVKLDLPGVTPESDMGRYHWRKDLRVDYQNGINDALVKLIGYGDRVC